MKIIPHTKPEARHCQIIAMAWLLKGAAIENDGAVKLRTGKGKFLNPAYAKLSELAPQCFQGERSSQLVWDLLDSMGLEQVGGKAGTGGKTLKIKQEPQEEMK
jgi:hypothetical protein